MPALLVRKPLLLLMILLFGACANDSERSAELEGALLAAKADCEAKPAEQSCLKLHVPSPDWRDQIIYFAMIDRFADGDISNNDQGVGVYDPSKESHYSGGDIVGLTERLDYIENLGATAVWITPPVANMWWDPQVSYGGYHGYWARDFKSVDEHYGSLKDYQLFSHELHSREMYLIQDIVVNHVGNYFSYKGEYDPKNPRNNFFLNPAALPTSAPTQSPFHMVDIFNDEYFDASIYNWTPEIKDFSDSIQETRYQTSSLSDLNTRNPKVIDALKESFSFWVREVGVDGFRIDTAKYVETEFYEDFLHSADGVYESAKQTGRDNFFTFGEVYNTSSAYQDLGEKKLAKYISSGSLRSMDAAIGFPLYKDIQRVFASGAPTDYLKYRVEKQMTFFERPFLQPNFIDNHDVERFLASANEEAFKLANVFMMTVPGIPMIYQGDEQLFTESRRAMFAGGYLNSKGSFDQNSSMYQFIQSLTKIRRENKVFSRGDIRFIQTSELAPGVLFYQRQLRDKVAFVIINTAVHTVILNADIGPKYWSIMPQKLKSFNIVNDVASSWSGNVVRELPAMSAQIYIGTLSSGKRQKLSEDQKPTSAQIKFLAAQRIFSEGTQVSFRGTSTMSGERLLVVVDGNLDTAFEIKTDDNGGWNVALDQNDLGRSQHSIELYSKKTNATSIQHKYTVIRETPEYTAKKNDPLGDDKGPSGKYVKPLHDSVGCHMDIEEASAIAAGTIMELQITMCDVSDMWAPSNLFDHVAFSIFFDMPSGEGKKQLPLIGGQFPGEGKWNYAHMSYGWGNYLYTSDGASNNAEGEKLGIAPEISVNKKNKTVSFRYSGAWLGISSWKNVKIYATTWDKDGTGNYRPLEKKATMWSFGSSDNVSADKAKILDDILLELVP